MGIVVERVDKDVRMPVPGHVFGMGHLVADDDPGRIDTARGGFLAQVGFRERIGFEHPQDAVLGLVHDPHPDIELAGADLVVVVKAAQHKGIFRQVEIGPGGRFVRNRQRVVIGQIGMRHVKDAFRIGLPVFGRDHGWVPHQIINEIGPCRAGEPDIAQMYRRQPVAEQAKSRVPRMPHEINGNIKFLILGKPDQGGI